MVKKIRQRSKMKPTRDTSFRTSISSLLQRHKSRLFQLAISFIVASIFLTLIWNQREELPQRQYTDGLYCHNVMRERLQRLVQFCPDELKRLEPESRFFHLNPFHKTGICAPHKTGSESWRVFLERLDMRDRNSTSWQSTVYQEWPENAAEEFILAFQVRHPMERLLSSYRYVFHNTDLHEQFNLNYKILVKYGDYPRDEKAESKGGKVFPKRVASFSEFVDFLIDEERDDDDDVLRAKGASSHWHSYQKQCNPCFSGGGLRPKFLLHLETFLNDADCYLDSVEGILDSDLESLFHVNGHPGGHSSLSDVKAEFFSQLTKEQIKRLYKVYELDHLLHGYTIDEYLKLGSET